MCGIAGFFTSPKSASNEALTATVRRMTDAIVTRGPDDEGAWTDADGQRRSAGTFGRAAVFSFNGNKIITTSGGGMVVTTDKALRADMPVALKIEHEDGFALARFTPN